MRKVSTDNYENFALLGNNGYDIIFMYYLFCSQNVDSYYCNKYVLDDLEKERNLKNIAYYFGTRGPVLIDDKGLMEIFKNNGIPRIDYLPSLSSKDIIDLIKMCLACDAVYVCNSNGKMDKYTMFILGYLMAMNQEIFFWNDIEKSEWLMSCIAKKNNNGYKELVQFPLEIIRNFAYPFLFQNIRTNLKSGQYGELVVTDEGKFGVDRNTEFNLQVSSQVVKKNTISLLGSLNKHLQYIKEVNGYFKNSGYEILAPKLSNIKTEENSFVIFENDISDDPIIIESDFLEKCLESEKIIVCDKDGYVGNTVMFEIGYLLGKNKEIEFMQEPKENWITEVVNYFSITDEKSKKLNKYIF